VKIFERARAIILKPKATWPLIRDEAVDIKQLLINYAAPLALIPAVSSFIGITLIGFRVPEGYMYRLPLVEALVGAVLGYVLNLAGVFVGGWAIKLLAPLFNSKADLNAAMKIVVYSLTPVWLVGIFSLIPGLGVLSILGLYGIYLLAVGLPVVMGTPPKKVVLYTISIIIAGFVISFVFSLALAILYYGPVFMRTMPV
jgi:hypothetical protein